MSIHSISKETGISEYALKKYARENGIRRGSSKGTRSDYKFSEIDIETLRYSYIRYEHESKPADEYVWIFYKKTLEDGQSRFRTPVGRFNVRYLMLLEKFVALQEYTSAFGRKANHFEIVNNHTAQLRIKKIFGCSKEELNETTENIVKQLPLSIKMVARCIEKRIKLKEDFYIYNKI